MKIHSILRGVTNVLPNAITQIIQFDNCINACPECHSKYLWEDGSRDMGLNELLGELDSSEDVPYVTIYGEYVSNPKSVTRSEFVKLLVFLKEHGYKVSVWSGRDNLEDLFPIIRFCDSIKIGRYNSKFGGLDQETTNQKFYQVTLNGLANRTYIFQQHKKDLE